MPPNDQNPNIPGRFESMEDVARRLQQQELPQDIKADLIYSQAQTGKNLIQAYNKLVDSFSKAAKLSDEFKDLEAQYEKITEEKAEGWERASSQMAKRVEDAKKSLEKQLQEHRDITSKNPQVIGAATRQFENIKEQDIRESLAGMSDADVFKALPQDVRARAFDEKMTAEQQRNILLQERVRQANLPGNDEYANMVNMLGPASANYMAADLSRPEGQKTMTGEDLLARGFGVQGAMNMAGDFLTPGGPSMARATGGLLQQGIGAAPFLAQVHPSMGFMASGGFLAAAGAGAIGYNTLMGLQEQTRGYERSFGENQGLGSPLLGAQVEARLSNWLLASEEIDSVTESLANFGATAEEASEALGPAAEALSQYRVLNAETAARAAFRGQQTSPIGAAEATVLGEVMERLSGGGFSAEAINQAAQTSSETYEPLGIPMSEYSGLGVVNMLQAGGPQTDMMLQQSGTAQRSIEIGGSIIADPMMMGMTANMYSSGTDYTSLDPSTPRGRAQANFALYDAVWNVSGDLRQNLNRDDRGNIIVTDADNIMSANLLGQMLAPMNGGQAMGGSELLGILATMESQGGREEAFQSMLGPEQMAQREREEERRNIGGAIQERTHGQAHQRGSAMLADQLSPIMGLPGMGGIEGITMGLSGFLSGKSAIQRGEAGSFAAADEWSRTSGGFMGTILGTEGQGFFDAGIDPSKVQVVGPGGGRWTLSEVSKDPDLLRRFEAGELMAEVGVGGETQRMTAEDLATAAYNDELKFDTGFLGIGKDKLTMGESTSGGGGGTVQVEFTGTAEEFFRTVDAKNPNSMAGTNVRATSSEETGRGNKELYNSRYLFGG